MIDRKKIIEEIMQNTISLKRKIMLEMLKHTDKFSITPSQCQIIFLVKSQDGISTNEIANILKISPSAVTQMTDALAASGYISRIQDKKDRRAIKISLSKKLKQKFITFRKLNYKKIADIFKVLSDKEIVEFAKISSKLT